MRAETSGKTCIPLPNKNSNNIAHIPTTSCDGNKRDSENETILVSEVAMRSWTGDNDRSGDEEEDYGYRYLVDNKDDEESDEPLDIVNDALGPEDGEGEVDEVNLLGFAAF